MKTISVLNQKGGVGKTTTAHALIGGLLERGFKVLGVDLDGQCNLSLATGASTKGATVLGVLTGELTADKAIQHTEQGDIIPASPRLAKAYALIESIAELKDALEPLQNNYDFCIIDTPPALGIMAFNALYASDSVVIPTKADLYSLQGIDELTDTITAVQQKNKRLKVAGILLTANKSRTTLHQDVLKPLSLRVKGLNTSLFNTTIRDAIAVSEAPFFQQSIFTYAPKANVTEDYRAFISELLERL